MTKLSHEKTQASSEIVGPMRFWTFWGPASVVRDWAFLFVELNTCEPESSRGIMPPAGEDITHTHPHTGVKLFS